jgi:hypothetical protein
MAWSKSIAKEIEALPPRGFRLVERQPKFRHHRLRPRQSLVRVSAAEDDEIVGKGVSGGHRAGERHRSRQHRTGLPTRRACDQEVMRIARFDPNARGIDCAAKRENVIGARDQRTTSGQWAS